MTGVPKHWTEVLDRRALMWRCFLLALGQCMQDRIQMKRRVFTALALVICLCFAAITWSYFDVSRHDANPRDSDDVAPGRLFAYRLTLPFDHKNAVLLEIRRVPSPHNQEYNVVSVDGNLRISREDADMIISTGLISSPTAHKEIHVSTCLLELNDILTDTSNCGDWAIAGRIGVPGVSTKLSPKENFCLGGLLSTGWERHPRWQDNEICVGRFRSHDATKIYDYYCVVVATKDMKR